MPFLADDSLNSLRYVRRFLQEEELTWTDGRPLEGYSNLLWILAVACLGSFGIDLIVKGRRRPSGLRVPSANTTTEVLRRTVRTFLSSLRMALSHLVRSMKMNPASQSTQPNIGM